MLEGERVFAANGFGGVDVEEDVENGFELAPPPIENGFAFVLELGLAPNNASPILTAGFEAATSGFAVLFSLFSFGVATSVILVPRNTLTLPSLRLHVLRRHVNTYNLLSCPGKCSGRSPLSWRRRTMRSLQTLHFARAADGGVVGLSHVWVGNINRCLKGEGILNWLLIRWENYKI